MKKSVSGMKFLPHDSRMENTVAATSAHFSGPFTTKQPNRNRNSTKAPTYTGPDVMGWVPKYWVSWPYRLPYIGLAFFMAVSLAERGDGSPALVVGHQQGQRLADAVAPLRDVVAVKSAAGLLGGIAGVHQLALAAHGFLAVRIGVVQVGEVGCHAHQAGYHQHGARRKNWGKVFSFHACTK